MGANLDYYIYRGHLDKMRGFHDKKQRDSCEENECDTYAGHLGMLPEGLDMACCIPLEDKDKAVAYLEEAHVKWECALAVPFKDHINTSQVAYVIGGWCAS